MKKINHAKRKLESDSRMNPPEQTKEHINSIIDTILNGQKDKECLTQD